ncbi:MAG: hypothetical protein ACOYOO_00775 [Saprospiraceae bacterium]
MIGNIRETYNRHFHPDKYGAFLRQFEIDFPGQLDFRVAETPVFVPNGLKEKLIAAGEQIIAQLMDPRFKEKTQRAIPPGQEAPNEDAHPSLLILDYAICRDGHGQLVPRLIELQGFASLFGYQGYLERLYPRFFFHPEGFSAFFDDLDQESYFRRLKDFFCEGIPPEQVALMEIFPEKQKTRIDFAATERFTGIPTVCLTQVKKSGRTLYYEKAGKKTEIRRIYNRVIFDELDTMPGLKTAFHLTDDVDVEWIAHPNWFFRISKFTLPMLQGEYIPKSFYLHELKAYPDNLDAYVLKPLFSFAGQGVRIHVTREMLDAIPNKENYLLQERVDYHPAVLSPGGGVKVELRMMYIWPKGQPRPQLLTNLGRMSKGEMVGVRYNAQFDWVGGTIAYFEK